MKRRERDTKSDLVLYKKREAQWTQSSRHGKGEEIKKRRVLRRVSEAKSKGSLSSRGVGGFYPVLLFNSRRPRARLPREQKATGLLCLDVKLQSPVAMRVRSYGEWNALMPSLL